MTSLLTWLLGNVDDLGVVATDVHVSVLEVDVAARVAAVRALAARNVQLHRYFGLAPALTRLVWKKVF